MFLRYFILLFLLSSSIVFTQSKLDSDSSSYLSPIKLENPEKYYKLGNVYLGAQPDSSTLVWFLENDVTQIINLRSEKENKKFFAEKFNPMVIAEKYGVTYTSIPMGGDNGYNPKDVEKFSNLISDTTKITLLHCNSGGRASHLWIAYLANYKNIPLNEAVQVGKKLKVSFPFEDLLGYPVAIEKK